MFKCSEKKDSFCFVCGKIGNPMKKISKNVAKAYKSYFGINVLENVSCAPSNCCPPCFIALIDWYNGKRRSLSFGRPMIWKNPGLHNKDKCYFCVNKLTGRNMRTKKYKVYHSVPSTELPLPHSDEIPIPTRPDTQGASVMESEPMDLDIMPSTSTDDDMAYRQPTSYENVGHPELFSQAELEDFCRVWRLGKDLSEVAGSRLRQKHLWEPGVNITFARKRHKHLKNFFSFDEESKLAFCNDVR